MNRFTPDDQSVLDSADNPWPVNQWRRIPIPEGIEISATYPRSLAAGFWLVQAPLPPVPEREKTQPELDDIEFYKWYDGRSMPAFFECWHAACRYARQQMAPEGIV